MADDEWCWRVRDAQTHDRAELERWRYLHEIYVEMYLAIAKYRPSIGDALARVIDAASTMDYDTVAALVDRGFAEMDATDQFVEFVVENAHPTTASAIETLHIVEAYRRMYTHFNYWHVLLDGVFLEGVFEELGESLVTDVAAAVGSDAVTLLATIIDPATRAYTTTRDDDTTAKHHLEQLVRDVRAASEELGDRLSGFVQLYASSKHWQEQYKARSRRSLQRFIPFLRDKIAEISFELGEELSEDDLLPFHLLDVIEERLLPAYLSQGMWTRR